MKGVFIKIGLAAIVSMLVTSCGINSNLMLKTDKDYYNKALQVFNKYEFVYSFFK